MLPSNGTYELRGIKTSIGVLNSPSTQWGLLVFRLRHPSVFSITLVITFMNKAPVGIFGDSSIRRKGHKF